MLRTIQNVVDMTADVYKTPYLKIDLMCEDSGIEAIPKVPDIIAVYHKIIIDVSASVLTKCAQVSVGGKEWVNSNGVREVCGLTVN